MNTLQTWLGKGNPGAAGPACTIRALIACTAEGADLKGIGAGEFLVVPRAGAAGRRATATQQSVSSLKRLPEARAGSGDTGARVFTRCGDLSVADARPGASGSQQALSPGMVREVPGRRPASVFPRTRRVPIRGI